MKRGNSIMTRGVPGCDFFPQKPLRLQFKHPRILPKSLFYEGDMHEGTLPRLQISLGSRRVNIVPSGGDVAEPNIKRIEGGVWASLVVVNGDSLSFELWLLMTGGDEDPWYLRDGRDGSIRPLTEGSFGRAMVELFS
jgi:hypothetical protein